MGKKRLKRRSVHIRKTVFFFIIFPVLVVDLTIGLLYLLPRNSKNKIAELILVVEQWHNEQIAKVVLEQALPKDGFTTKIVLGNIVPKLISYGVIDKGKMGDLYKTRGGLSQEQRDLLNKNSNKPLTVNAQ
ncbi:MAG TPA: hypothetical protein VEP90_12700, partial [Methylomirabilota bacterium]|nr:hypothetical protein [Methylomirabilota bacterium]